MSAYLITGLAANHNAIRWAAIDFGADGNDITVALTNPGVTHTLSVLVSGTDITVTLGWDLGAITSTAAGVIAAVQASVSASALVTVSHSGVSSGVGIVSATIKTSLAGGVSEDINSAIYALLSGFAPLTDLVPVRQIVEPPYPENWPCPYVCFWQSGGVPKYVMGGESGIETDQFTIQSVAATADQARVVAKQVRLRMSGYAGVSGTISILACSLVSPGQSKGYALLPKLVHVVEQVYEITYRVS